MKNLLRNWPTTLSLALIIGFQCYYWQLRLGGTWLGPEQPLHRDEKFLSNIALSMVARGDANPYWFGHPAATLIYPLAAAHYIHLKVFPQDRARLVDWDNRRKANPPDIPPAEALFVRTSRVVAAAYYFLSGLALFWLAKSVAGVAPSLVSVLLLLQSPLYVRYGPLFRNDATTVFFATVALGMILRASRSTSLVWHISAGLAVGAAIATKYYLAYTAIAYIGTMIRLCKECGARRVLILFSAVTGGVLLGLFLTSPYVFLDAAGFWHSLNYQVQHVSKNPPLQFFEQLGFFLKIIWESVGIVGLALTFLGVITLFKKNDAVAVMTALSVVVFLFVISLPRSYYDRWVMAAFPPIAVFTAEGIRVSVEALHHFFRRIVLQAKAGYHFLWIDSPR